MTNNPINKLSQDLDQSLQAALTQTAQDINISDIGVSVGLVTPEGTWTGATGISNIDTQQATETDDLFNIGSISKAYTSSVILTLQEQGKLSLDDTIDRWLPEIASQITNGTSLTIRQILNGKGGLWDYTNGNEEFLSDLIADYFSGANRDWQPEDLIAYAFGKPLFSGGASTEEWTYTNTGNVIAALIAEKATGKLFKDILAEEILAPLGLTNTFFTTEDVNLEQRARGYEDLFTTDGNLGIDALDGGKGNDLIKGGKGNDVLFGKEGNDNLYGGRDDDLLKGDDFLQGGKGSDVLIGGNGQDNLNGGKDDDILSGGAGKDVIRDTQGNNIFYGNNGDDLLFAGKGDDALYGDAGNDRLIANAGNDLLLGGSGDDYLNGGKGDDNLLGLEGDDTLIGSSGNNILSGGAGSDRFVLASKGTAIITDFTQGEDFLELPENISFKDLEIIQGSGENEDDTLINWQSANLAVLDNIDATEINTSDFINLFPTFSLPEPTGDYAVGTTSYHFIDSEQEETYTEDPNDNREITAKVWYPSVEVPEADTASYFSEELSSAIALGLDIPPEDFINVVNSISTNSVTNAPVAEAESEYPVLIFSHGSGDLPELNAVTAEELASQGYVVVALNHTYDSTVNVFPDGRIIPRSPILDEAEDDEVIELRAEDAQFVLDELEEIDAGDDPTGLFSGKLDLERVGMYGSSFGGATAAKVLSVDSRFKAGINLDGPLYGDVANASLSQPFMFLNSENFGTEDSPFNQLQQSFVENLQNDGYEVKIRGAGHSNFSDFPFLVNLLLNAGIELEDLAEIFTPTLNNSEDFEAIDPSLAAQIINDYEAIDPNLAAQIINDYTVAFFEQYLNDRESPLLEGNSSPYPEVIFQSYNTNSAFVFNFADNVPQSARDGMEKAGEIWSSKLGNDVTITIDVGFEIPSSESELASANSTTVEVAYSDFYQALVESATSADDAITAVPASLIAIANLPSGDNFNLLINNTQENQGSDEIYLDNNNSANNSTIELTNANAKALSLAVEDDIDAKITFNSDVSWDFDNSDGVAEDLFDFESFALHEIGHTLGFTSGVDNLDTVAGQNLKELITSDEVDLSDIIEFSEFEEIIAELGLEEVIENVDLGELIAGSPLEPLLENIQPDLLISENNYIPSSMDLFRFSNSSADLGVIDFTTGEEDKYFSLDRGQTEIAQLSTGVYLGDGGQISHWKQEEDIGIMKPAFGSGEIIDISNNDLKLLDAIGWEIV